jgi:2-dehydropantoate 2-reductase
VLGSLYAAKLRQAGHDVSILARGQRLADLQASGIVLEEARTGVRTSTPVDVVDRLEPRDAYDVVLVIVRKDQLPSVLPIVGANRGTPTVLFMVNNASGPEALTQAVGRERVLLGFAGAGGTREADVVRYHILPAWQQATTLGELDGKRTPRLEQIAAALRQSGFPTALSARMDAWLTTHVVWTCPAAHALYMVGGSNDALARTRDAVVLWVRAVREGYRAMRRLGMPITPAILRVFEVIPEPLFVAFLRRLLDTPTAELVIARHANTARAEYVQLGNEFLALAQRAGVPTPAFDRLRPYVDPAVPPIGEGSAELPLRWKELGVWLGGLVALVLITRRLLRR